DKVEVQFGDQVSVQKGQLVEVEGTNISVLLPEDLPEGTEIKISENTEVGAEGLKAAGDIVDVEIILPEGAEEPKGDYELTLGVNDDAADKDAAIYYLNEDKWEEQGGSVDGEHNTISTNVSHFSTYGVFIDETPAGDDEEPTIVVEGDDDKLDNDEEED